MDQEEIVKDVGYGDTHKRILSGLPKEEMIKEYAKWAPTYDSQCIEDKATHKEISAKRIINALNGTKSKIQVLDAACGTGMVAEWFKYFANEKHIEFDMVGVDFSPEMLLEARKKNIYVNLIEADLNEDMELEEGFFDAFMAVGLFIDGHCGPEIIPRLVKYIKPGGIGIITVRKKTYEKREVEYLRNFKLSNLSVIQNEIDDYLAGVEANYIILKKNA